VFVLSGEDFLDVAVIVPGPQRDPDAEKSLAGQVVGEF